MNQIHLKLERAFCFFLVFLFLEGCAPLSTKQWAFQDLSTGYPRFDGERIFYKGVDTLYGMELSFMKGSYGVRGFISVYTHKLPKTPSRFLAIIIEKQTFQCQVMEGEQQLALPKEAIAFIFKKLKSTHSIFIVIPNTPFHLTVLSSNFKEVIKNRT
mgnify:CR=1 FL=1